MSAHQPAKACSFGPGYFYSKKIETNNKGQIAEAHRVKWNAIKGVMIQEKLKHRQKKKRKEIWKEILGRENTNDRKEKQGRRKQTIYVRVEENKQYISLNVHTSVYDKTIRCCNILLQAPTFAILI